MHDACEVIATEYTIDERFEQPWQPLKGISIKYIVIEGYITKKLLACGVIDTACTKICD
jgi:hypothetical protein